MQHFDYLHIPNTRPVIECKIFTFCTECDAVWLGKATTCEWCGSSEIEHFKAYMSTPVPQPIEVAALHSSN